MTDHRPTTVAIDAEILHDMMRGLESLLDWREAVERRGFAPAATKALAPPDPDLLAVAASAAEKAEARTGYAWDADRRKFARAAGAAVLADPADRAALRSLAGVLREIEDDHGLAWLSKRAKPCHDEVGHFVACGTPNPHRRAHGRWRHQDRIRKVRGAEHADLIADAHKDRKATARDLKRERRTLRKDQRKERRSLNRDGKRQVAKLDARHAREAAGSRNPARTGERHRDERAELAATLREDRAGQRDEHAEQRSTLRQDHRDRVHDELESAREVHFYHRRDQLHDNREARGEAPEGDMPGGKSFAAKAPLAAALDRLQQVADRLLKAVEGPGETAENLGNIGESWANTLGWKGVRKPKPPKGKPAAKPHAKPCHDAVGQFTACGTAGGAGPKKPKPPKTAKPKPGGKKKPPKAPKAPKAPAKPTGGAKPNATPERRTSRFQIPEQGPGVNRKLAIYNSAQKAERNLAKDLHGRHVGDHDSLRDKQNPSYDIHIPAARSGSGRDEFLEMKYKSEGAKNVLSIHPDALLRKADHHAEDPKAGYGTVLVDVRDRSFGGSEAEHYSGHDLYYRRGTGGNYSTLNMYKCKNTAELSRLIAMPDRKLPPLARGTMPVRTPELVAQAATVAASRARRDAGGKKQERARRAYERKKAGLIGTAIAAPEKP